MPSFRGRHLVSRGPAVASGVPDSGGGRAMWETNKHSPGQKQTRILLRRHLPKRCGEPRISHVAACVLAAKSRPQTVVAGVSYIWIRPDAEEIATRSMTASRRSAEAGCVRGQNRHLRHWVNTSSTTRANRSRSRSNFHLGRRPHNFATCTCSKSRANLAQVIGQRPGREWKEDSMAGSE